MPKPLSSADKKDWKGWLSSGRVDLGALMAGFDGLLEVTSVIVDFDGYCDPSQLLRMTAGIKLPL